MIVRENPSTLQLFFVMQGSIIPKIFTKILGIALLSTLVLLLDIYIVALPHISISAMGIFGVALSLFLGFRNNAAYDRWWEARKLWGSIIADIRSLGQQMRIFLGTAPQKEHLLTTAVAFAHLHRGHLRGVDVKDEITDWISADTANAICAHQNPTDAALRSMADQIGALSSQNTLSGFGQITMSQTLTSLASAQAACERILTTPLPFVYSLLIRRTTYLYCALLPFALIETTGVFAPLFSAAVAYVFFGLQAVTNELELPFRNVPNGLPLDAMCRSIEISVCEALDRTAPKPRQPVDYILS